MTDDELLTALGTRSPRHVLEDLVPVARALAASGRPRPEVDLYLASGQQVKGRVIAVGDDRASGIVVLQVGGTPRAPATIFVCVDEIAAVALADASLLVRAPVSDEPAPSRLELQRQIAAKSDGLATKLGRAPTIALPGDLDEDSRRALGALLPVLVDVLTAIGHEDLGRAALRELATIDLVPSPEAVVWKDGATLFVRAPTQLTRVWSFRTLREAIEKQL